MGPRDPDPHAAGAAVRPGEQLRSTLGEIRRDIVALLAELDGAGIGVEIAGRTQGATAG